MVISGGNMVIIGILTPVRNTINGGISTKKTRDMIPFAGRARIIATGKALITDSTRISTVTTKEVVLTKGAATTVETADTPETRTGAVMDIGKLLTAHRDKITVTTTGTGGTGQGMKYLPGLVMKVLKEGENTTGTTAEKDRAITPAPMIA